MFAINITHFAFADERTSISGTIVDDIDNSPLVGVTVYLPDLKIGTSTDINGFYEIKNLPLITTVIQVSYLGHQTIIESVDLKTTSQKNFRLKENNAMLNEVVVVGLTGNSLIRQTPSPITVVSNSTLQQTTSANLIDALAKQPGVSQITTGSGISKPVIRGLGYNRVAIVNDGIRQEGQQWGDEHGVEIDGNSIHSVQILKGPASLIYGSDALAGVIVMNNAPSVPEGELHANINSEYQTNNGLFNYSANLSGNHDGFVWNGRWSQKWAHDYKNKYDGRVFNSRFQEQAATAMMGFNKHWGHSHLHASYYHITPGIIEGERDATSGKFIMPVNNGGSEDEEIYDGSRSYSKAVPYQNVDHYKIVSDNAFFIGNGQLKVNIGYQQNVRKEYEDVVMPDEAELHFQLHTFSYNAHYLFNDLNGWRMASGINGMFQSSKNKGEEYLVPDYNSIDFGIFATANKAIGRWNVSGGLRFDNRHIHGKELIEEGETRFSDFKRDFSGLTGSIGATYNINDKTNVKFNISRGFRAPNISELGSNGVHEGTIRYEIGNTHLKPEKSLQFDLSADYSSKWISLQAALFANKIDDYIFLHKLSDEDGNEIIMDDVPTFGFSQSNAWVYGTELIVDIHPWEPLHFENSFAFVNATRSNASHDDKYLPFTPAPRWNANLKYDIIRHGILFDNLFVALETETCFRQNHFYAAYETETSTPSYTLLNISAGTDILNKGRKVATVVIAANNVTDCAYQNHLSRLKYADVNQATGRRGVFNMGRNFIIKVAIPFNIKLH